MTKKHLSTTDTLAAVQRLWPILRRIVDEDMILAAQPINEYPSIKPGLVVPVTYFDTPAGRLRLCNAVTKHIRLEILAPNGDLTMLDFPQRIAFNDCQSVENAALALRSKKPERALAQILSLLALHLDHEMVIEDDRVVLRSTQDDRFSMNDLLDLLAIAETAYPQHHRQDIKVAYPFMGLNTSVSLWSSHALFQRSDTATALRVDAYARAHIRPRMAVRGFTDSVRGDPRKQRYTLFSLNPIECLLTAQNRTARLGAMSDSQYERLADIARSLDIPLEEIRQAA